MMNPVVHFEMPYEDKDRAADFYGKAFGWKANMLGAEMGNYVVMHTTETDEKNMIKEPGRINGGLYAKSPTATQGPSVVIAVEDIQAGMKRVEEAGGKIIGGRKSGEPDDIPGVGKYISFYDSEGNRVGMLEPSGSM